MRALHFIAACCWYGLSQGIVSFMLPFLPIYYSELGFMPSQIGLLSALRPWISAPCGSIAAAFADRLGAHRFVLLFCFTAATALQGSMALVTSFPFQLALTFLVSTVWTGGSIIADASVMAASNHPGDYGRVRTWASVAWVVCAPIAGIVNEKYGMKISAAVFFIGSLLAVPAGYFLPVEFLKKRVLPEEKAAAAEITAPLLAEEAPPFAAERPALSRALGIVRLIEAITELGAVPPPGTIYGFAEVTTPYAASHFQQHLADQVTDAGAAAVATEQRQHHGSAFAPTTEEERHEMLHQLEDEYHEHAIYTPFAAAASPSSYHSATSGHVNGLFPSPARPIPNATAVSSAGRSRKEEFEDKSPVSSSHSSAHHGIEEEEDIPVDERFSDAGHSGPSATGREFFPTFAGRRYNSQEFPNEAPFPASSASPTQRSLHPMPKILKVRIPSSGDLMPHRQHAQQAAMTRNFSANDLLRSVRDIKSYQHQPSEHNVDEETLAWVSSVAPSDQQQGPEDEDTTHPARLLRQESREGSPPPEQRASALQRLAQLFNWRSGTLSSGNTPRAAAAGIEDEEDAETATPRSSTADANTLLAGFSPIQSYLDARKRRLEHSGSSTQRLTALVGEPSLMVPLQLSTEEGNATVAVPLPQTEDPASHGASISPEMMREALDMEAAEVAANDPTGSLVVDVLSKKLKRMVEEEARNRRRRARKLRAEALKRSREEPPLPPSYAPPGDAAAAAEAPSPSPPGIAALFRNPSILSFFLIATLLGFGHGVIGTFLFMFLKHLGAGESLMGWVLLANALPELPVFWFFGAILHTVGMDTLLLASTAALGLRIAAYILFSKHFFAVQWILLLETVHCISYACGWSACALNASKIAPPGLESTTQALFQGLWSGIGAGSGGLLGGLLYHWGGPDALFTWSAAVILLGCAVAGVVLALQHRKRRHLRMPTAASIDALMTLTGNE